jgi:hypothetical protein
MRSPVLGELAPRTPEIVLTSAIMGRRPTTARKSQTRRPARRVPQPKGRKTMGTETDYVLLSRDDSGLWKQRQTVKASGAEAAVRKGASGAAKVWVAVPLRSWQPMGTEIVTTERLQLTLMKPDAPDSPAAD